MPSFDIVSEVDRQEVRNAVDQAQRELETRFDFKGTDSSIEQKDLVLTLRSASDDRLRAVKQVVEERLVKRNVSLKGLDWGKVEEAASATVRQVVTITVGINADKAREINRMIKEKGPKGVSSQTQGEQVRVTGKKRDDLQAVMALLKAADLGIPLQFNNFRDYTPGPMTDYARLQVGGDKFYPQSIERRTDGGDLVQHIEAVAILIHHSLNPGHLAGDPFDPSRHSFPLVRDGHVRSPHRTFPH